MIACDLLIPEIFLHLIKYVRYRNSPWRVIDLSNMNLVNILCKVMLSGPLVMSLSFHTLCYQFAVVGLHIFVCSFIVQVFASAGWAGTVSNATTNKLNFMFQYLEIFF